MAEKVAAGRRTALVPGTLLQSTIASIGTAIGLAIGATIAAAVLSRVARTDQELLVRWRPGSILLS